MTRGLSRREAMALAAAAAACRPGRAAAASAEEGAGGIVLTLPTLAENGFSVPVVVEAPGAEAILLVAPRNPEPQAVVFRFGRLAGASRIDTRIRLAESQTVRAQARFPGGRVVEAEQAVEVVVGGCDL